MAQTPEGRKKAVKTIYAKFGKDYFIRVGALGGQASRGYAFAHGRVNPSQAGAKGGKLSKRGVNKKTIVKAHKEFQSGFNQPSWSQKVLRRLKRA